MPDSPFNPPENASLFHHIPGDNPNSASLLDSYRELMDGYKKALRSGDELHLDSVNKSLLHHVITLSSEAAHYRLVTRTGNTTDMASELKTFTTELAARDRAGQVLSFGTLQAKELIKSVGITALIGTVLGFLGGIINAVAEAGKTAANDVNAQRFVIRLMTAGGGLSLVGKYWTEIKSTFNIELPAQKVLADNVDVPERKFFGMTGGNPPSRVALNSLGPLGAVLMTLPGLVVGWFIFNMFV